MIHSRRVDTYVTIIIFFIIIARTESKKNKHVFDNILHIHTHVTSPVALSQPDFEKSSPGATVLGFTADAGSEVEVTRPSVTKKCQIVTLATNFHRFYLVLHTSVGVA